MATLEELRDDEYLLSIFEDVAKTQIPPQVAYAWFQKRLAAAREDGAEQERERILELVKGEYHVGPPFYLKLRNPLEPDPEWYVLLPKNVFWQDGNSGGCGTPAAILAPTEPDTKEEK
jgi:hypothetical protein